MKLILHSYRRCPFCIRTRVLLYLKGLEYEIVEEPLREWTPWMKKWSEETGERPRVPVLRSLNVETGEEMVLPESNQMNLYIDALDGKPEYTPAYDSSSYIEMLEWWKWCDEALKPAIDLYKYGKDLQFDREAHDAHSLELQKLVQILEDHLSERAFIVEERLTLTDIAIIPFIRQIMRTREGEFDFTSYPRVRSWAATILETDWFQNVVMKKQ